MATFKMKMEKNHLKKIVILFSYYFDKGSQDAILKHPWKSDNILFSFNLFKAYTF